MRNPRAIRWVTLVFGSSVLGLSLHGAEGLPPSAASKGDTSRLTEKVEVRLVLLDVVVVDGDGRPVPHLSKDDFLLTVDGGIVPVDTFDVSCDAPGGAPDETTREPRRVAFAIDYAHLGQDWRSPTLDAVRTMVRNATDPTDRFMVAALTSSLRIEQSFTADRGQVLRTLDRMEKDVTLWADDFRHTSDEPYLDALIAFYSVLDAEPGSKAVVLLSNLQDLSGDVDSRMMKLAALAGSARASLHTVSARGLDVAAARTPAPRDGTVISELNGGGVFASRGLEKGGACPG